MDDVRRAGDALEAARAKEEAEYQRIVRRLAEEERDVERRCAQFEKKRGGLAAAHGNPRASPDDLVEINAGGKVIAARRGTLCQIEGTRLEALFSGRWERRLQRDREGRIFLDVNSEAFQAIVDYLNEMAISPADNPPRFPAADTPNLLELLLRPPPQCVGWPLGDSTARRIQRSKWQCDFCGTAQFETYDDAVLHESNCDRKFSFTESVSAALKKKVLVLRIAERKIALLEERLEDEEKLVDLFATGDTKDVVTLNVSGTMMATKRSTLMVFEDSVLAQQFDDTKWVKQGTETHRVKEWAPDDVFFWAQSIDDISDDIAQLFLDNQVTGNELLAFDREGLAMLGIKRAGTLCLLQNEIRKLEKASHDVSTLIEHSPYCFGKILDFLRGKYLHSQGLADDPDLPAVRVSERDRFEKVAKYYFPGDTSELMLGLIPITIKMANEARVDPNSSGNADNFLKDGRPLHKIALVAATRLAHEELAPGSFSMCVEDGTGFIPVTLCDEHAIQIRPTATKDRLPHLFLHFDVNETILIGDPAGGDSVEECLNKIIAKSAFVSTTNGAVGGSDGGDEGGVESGGAGTDGPPALKRTPSSGNIDGSSTHNLQPSHWWNGMPLQSNRNNVESPPPLYTGWMWPKQSCPYYRTAYKKQAKQFTLGEHGRVYRSLYEELSSKLGLDKRREEGGEKDGEEDDIFTNFVPAFFSALQHYFPSQGPPSPVLGNERKSIDSALPLPNKVTIALRTFGTDLPRVAKCISEFARGNHPSYPDYYNEQLILEERDLWRAAWSYKDDGELVYELHPANREIEGAADHSGDDEVLNYLQSRSIVGIQDNYQFWADNNHAPHAGKPVWARTDSTGGAGHRHDHHHILLDDNIHNDPYDGAGGIRIPRSGTSYESLRGEEALQMHGKHLIRVPTIRPLMEDGWFIEQIESARQRVYLEESGEEEAGPGDVILGMDAKKDPLSLVLTDRNLSEVDFQFMKLPLNLRSIDVSRNALKRFPEQIFAMSSLVHLDVSRNALQGIPQAINQLTNLETLNALSNHMRLRQLPLEELASLKRLKVLDLSYNKKLKQSALTTLEEALLPHNPQLEIRVTITQPKDGTEAKCSACDRDATLLQSQLEPLSTPQLSKRLERSFGVKLDKDTEQAFDRDYILQILLQCYADHGPREVRREEGVPISPQRQAALLREFEAIDWPRTTRERPKIRAEYYMILQKPGSGKPDSAKTKLESAKLTKYRSIFDLAVETLKEVDAAFAERFTALAVTKNFVGSPHIDTLNVGPFYGLSLGDFTGGGAIAVECSPFLVAEVDTLGRLGKVDGRFPHWVTPYEGTRYSLIYYQTSGSVEPQTTAIFEPPSICGW
ncbi:hypothetical protein ACHAXT_003765, partial [Thalassiosira profunda]